jgi:hypothetical protein
MSLIINNPRYGSVFAVADTFADLRSINSTQIVDGYSAIVKGAHSVADGFGGMLVWNPTSVAPDNDVSVIAPLDGSTGRWLKIAVGTAGPDAARVLFESGIILAPTAEGLAAYFATMNIASAESAGDSAASALDALNSANAASSSASLSLNARTAAEASRAAAVAAASQASTASLASGVYPIAYATTFPKGVTVITGGVGTGTGGTPNTYAGGVAGGPAGFSWTYTIGADGKLASYTITNPGLSTATTAPTLSLPSGGLVAPTIPVATVASLIADQQTYWTQNADGSQLLRYGNNGGAVATAPFGGAQLSIDTSSRAAAALANQSLYTNRFTIDPYGASKAGVIPSGADTIIFPKTFGEMGYSGYSLPKFITIYAQSAQANVSLLQIVKNGSGTGTYWLLRQIGTVSLVAGRNVFIAGINFEQFVAYQDQTIGVHSPGGGISLVASGAGAQDCPNFPGKFAAPQGAPIAPTFAPARAMMSMLILRQNATDRLDAHDVEVAKISRPYNALFDINSASAAFDSSHPAGETTAIVLNDAFGKINAVAGSVMVDQIEIWMGAAASDVTIDVFEIDPLAGTNGQTRFVKTVGHFDLVQGYNLITAPANFAAFTAEPNQTLSYTSLNGGIGVRSGAANWKYVRAVRDMSGAWNAVQGYAGVEIMMRARYWHAIDEDYSAWEFYTFREPNGNETFHAYRGRNGRDFTTELPITYTGRPAASTSFRDPSVHYNRKTRTRFLAHSAWFVESGPTKNTFFVAMAQNNTYDFKFVAAISPDATLMSKPNATGGFGPLAAWAPEWFIDDDGTTYIIVAHHYGYYTDSREGSFADLTTYVYKSASPTHDKFTLVGPLTGNMIPRLGGPVDRTTCFDCSIMRVNGVYQVVGATRTTPQTVFRAVSSSGITGPYDAGQYPFVPDMGTGGGHEAPNQMMADDGAQRVITDNFAGAGLQMAESHDYWQTYTVNPIVLPGGIKPRHGDVIRINGPKA